VSLGSKKKHQLPPKVTTQPVTVVQEKPAPEKEQEPLLAFIEETKAPVEPSMEIQKVREPATNKSRSIKKKVIETFTKRFHRTDPLPTEDDGPHKTSILLGLIALILTFFAAIFMGLFGVAFVIYGVEEIIFLFTSLGLSFTAVILAVINIVRTSKDDGHTPAKKIGNAALIASLIVFMIGLIVGGFYLLDFAYG